ncbi:MAG: DUF445 domain-containing protein [Actinomycetota bacterium]
MEESPEEQQRRHDLRRMKGVALSLLLAAAVVYVVTTAIGADGALGYVQAFAEAAMVGALADWFAVTALFRHPLGLPIPHTAIIPRRKDQIGQSLGDFVETNFLTDDVLRARLEQADIGRRLGEWLAEPVNAQRAAIAAEDAVRRALDTLDDDEIRAGVAGVVRRRIEDTPASPTAGRALDIAIDGGHHQQVLDAAIVGVARFLGTNREAFQNRIYDESPWWVPEALDDRVLGKIYDVLGRFLSDVQRDPQHQLRAAFDQQIRDLAWRLKHAPGVGERGEQLKRELLDNPGFPEWIESLTSGTKRALLEATDGQGGELRQRTAAALQQLGERLSVDRDLQATVDRQVIDLALQLVDRYRSEATDLIASTVERWDADDTARRVELQVGRDLQFIRINGTLVGGLAGLVIHAFSELL